jgi:hypothetical protein
VHSSPHSNANQVDAFDPATLAIVKPIPVADDRGADQA